MTISVIYLTVLHISPFFCLYDVCIVHFSIECILRNISYENVEIQKIRFTILLVHGKITFIQISRRMSICFSRFQVIVELSCDSIFVELFVSVSVHYKFTIPLLKQTFSRDNKYVRPVGSSQSANGDTNPTESVKTDNLII